MKAAFDTAKLRCTACKGEALTSIKESLICKDCGQKFDIRDNKLLFVKVDEGVVSDGLDRIKYFFKKYHKFYNFLVEVISPVYPSANIHTRMIVKNEIAGKGITAINLGSGYSNMSDHLYNVDLLPYPPVDVVCDIENLPFKDNSIDYIINSAVLEHVPYPAKAIAEIHRVLKPGGKLYCFIPFIQGFHASPYDFQRYTIEGMKIQFAAFDIQKIYSTGPTSGMLWILQEWIAMILSFGIKPLHTFTHILIMALTWPLKFLDIIFDHHPMAKNIASGFSVECVKRDS